MIGLTCNYVIASLENDNIAQANTIGQDSGSANKIAQ